MTNCRIPYQVVLGKLSHSRKENRELRAAMTELLAATDARLSMGSDVDRSAINQRVRDAYDQCCVLIYWEGERIHHRPNKLKKLNQPPQQGVFDGILPSTTYASP